MGLIFFKGHAGAWLVALVSVLALWEVYGMFALMGFAPSRKLGATLASLMVLGAYYAPATATPTGAYAYAAFSLVLAVGTVAVYCTLSRHFNEKRIEALLSTLFGLVWVPFMLQFLVLIPRHFEDEGQGILLGVWLIAVAKFSDVGGLLVGSRFGRHKMAPQISPGKTWEGAAGGVLFSALVGAAIHALFHRFMPEGLTPLTAVAIAVPVGIVAIVSDLIESMLKRHANVKDSGNVIPGIGGAFDLVDSLILTAPLGYMLFSVRLF